MPDRVLPARGTNMQNGDVGRAVQSLVEQYGIAGALGAARRRIDGMESLGEKRAAEMWRRVLEAIEHMQEPPARTSK
jgi:hypothetical protein